MLLVTCLPAFAKDTAIQKIQLPQATSLYQSEFKRIKGSTATESLEGLFRMGEQAKEAFLLANAQHLEAAQAEALEDNHARSDLDKFTVKLTRMTPGYRITQGAELFYYEVDAKAFMALAKLRGDKLDQDFFTRYQASFPESETWPAHEEQQTDISSCTKYGSKAFTGHYQRWQAFLSTHPSGFYADKAKVFLERFDVTQRCSCDNRAATLSGLRNLEKAVPPGPLKNQVGAEIKKRSTDKEGAYDYDAQCREG